MAPWSIESIVGPEDGINGSVVGKYGGHQDDPRGVSGLAVWWASAWHRGVSGWTVWWPSGWHRGVSGLATWWAQDGTLACVDLPCT